MKKYIAACAVVLATALMFNAGIASAAPVSKTTSGKTVSFANGKLKVKNKRGVTTYVVGKKTDCGYSTGQMGNSMPCSRLNKVRYMKKSVTVEWHNVNGRRIADLVAVHL